MPLETQLFDKNARATKTRKMPWSWEDRMILCKFVILDGGQVGEVKELAHTSWLEMGYAGAGVDDHIFANEFGYCQVDTKTTILIKPGQTGYREYRAA